MTGATHWRYSFRTQIDAARWELPDASTWSITTRSQRRRTNWQKPCTSPQTIVQQRALDRSTMRTNKFRLAILAMIAALPGFFVIGNASARIAALKGSNWEN